MGVSEATREQRCWPKYCICSGPGAENNRIYIAVFFFVRAFLYKGPFNLGPDTDQGYLGSSSMYILQFFFWIKGDAGMDAPALGRPTKSWSGLALSTPALAMAAFNPQAHI